MLFLGSISMKNTFLTAAIPRDLYERLGEVAKVSDRSLSGEVRVALRKHLAEVETKRSDDDEDI